MLAFRSWPPHGWRWNGRTELVVGFTILTVWGLVDALNLLRGARKTTIRSWRFAEINDQGGNAAGYLATYLLPFIGLTPVEWGDWTAYSIYFVVAAIVFVRTDLTLINPTLYIFGYRVVSANAYLPDGDMLGPIVAESPFIVVCRNHIELGSGVIDVVPLGGGFITKQKTVAK